jgi:uncharacterized membrane protein YkoI
MRLTLAALCLVTLLAPALAETARRAPRDAGCLSDRDMREVLEEKRVVPPIAALRAARAKSPGDALRARLCMQGEDLVYIVTVLGKDGKIVLVNIDGRSGKPVEH